MAVNLQAVNLARVAKRFGCRISSPAFSIVPSSLRRNRSVHDSVYEKNHEELVPERVHSTMVPDDLIQSQPDEYWTPHPQTGVFGPASDQSSASPDNSNDLGSDANTDSVLEQKAFFRPSEDLDKPVVQP